jgi:hypothetical protein
MKTKKNQPCEGFDPLTVSLSGTSLRKVVELKIKKSVEKISQHSF